MTNIFPLRDYLWSYGRTDKSNVYTFIVINQIGELKKIFIFFHMKAKN